MKESRHSGLGLYTIGIAALFLAGFFLLVVFGAQSYRNTVDGQYRNMHSRALLSYLSTTVKAYDAEGTLRIDEDKDLGKVLVLLEGRSGYALRIYRADGCLVEDYARADAALRPEDAQIIGTTQRFDPVLTSDGLLTVSCDAGKVLLHLRSTATHDQTRDDPSSAGLSGEAAA